MRCPCCCSRCMHINRNR